MTAETTVVGLMESLALAAEKAKAEARIEEKQAETDILRAAAQILEADADLLEDWDTTDAEYARLRRAARICQIASNCRWPS